MTKAIHGALRSGLAGLVLAAAAFGQVNPWQGAPGTQNPNGNPWQQGQGYPQGYPGGYPLLPNDPRYYGLVQGGIPGSSQDGFPGLRTVIPRGQGFPSLDPQTGRFARTSTSSLQDLMSALSRGKEGQIPSPVQPTDAWPAWVKLPQNQIAQKRTATHAILIRSSERVWVLDPGEPAFVPLWFWDKFRVVQKGSAMDVRHMNGEFEVSMHDGGQFRSHGVARVSLAQLDEEIVEFVLEDLREIWWNGHTRLAKFQLPNGGQLEVPQASIRISSDGDVATITNFGPNPVRYKNGSGQVELTHGNRLRFFMTPRSGESAPVALTIEGELQQELKGRTLEVVGRGPQGRLSWSGARIAVPAGSRLVLDPLAGRDFPENKPRPK